MSDFAREIGAAFDEAACETGTTVRLTNNKFRGTISLSRGDAPGLETGWEGRDNIVIAIPVTQFDYEPDPTKREVVSIDDGPHKGDWLLTGLRSDDGHHYLSCVPRE